MFRPHTAEEVAAMLKMQTEPLHISYDNTEHASAATLSMSALDRVLAYEPEEMIVTVESGTRLLELESLLASREQWIPSLVANEYEETTLGQAVINDRFHPRASTLGMLRTAILGGRFCTTDGTLFVSGSRVVKSVAGYDIHRAFCGSKGLFGAIVSLTLKVQPKPQCIVRFTARSEAFDIIQARSPSILVRLEDECIVELVGFDEDVRESKASLANEIREYISDEQWPSVLTRIRNTHPYATLSQRTQEVLTSVRAVFDPKQILV